ncbi:MAG: ribosome maturation factor RimP [Clostridiales bacterium]|nr:ribosome maturation factor RimP [Clostridiales bacterium]
MSRGKTEKIAEELALPVAEQLNYEIVDIEYKREGPNWILRYFIDKEGGIGLDDCQKFSTEISTILDREDPIANHYYLEVSSPGLDRPLKRQRDFEKYTGSDVELRLYRAIDNRKKYIGELLGLEDDEICLKVDGEEKRFKRDDVSIVKLVIDI